MVEPVLELIDCEDTPVRAFLPNIQKPLLSPPLAPVSQPMRPCAPAPLRLLVSQSCANASVGGTPGRRAMTGKKGPFSLDWIAITYRGPQALGSRTIFVPYRPKQQYMSGLDFVTLKGPFHRLWRRNSGRPPAALGRCARTNSDYRDKYQHSVVLHAGIETLNPTSQYGFDLG
jgi:hypothetical protein